MKNPSLVAATALIGVAVLIGAFMYMSDDSVPTGSADLVQPGPERVTFSQELSPQERRKKGRLEEARRYLDRVKQEGVEVSPGLVRIKDTDGSPLYISTELVEGWGTYGEPKYLMAKTKRQAGVPVRKRANIPEELRPKLSKTKAKVNFAKMPGSGGGGSGSGGGSGGSGEGDGTDTGLSDG